MPVGFKVLLIKHSIYQPIPLLASIHRSYNWHPGANWARCLLYPPGPAWRKKGRESEKEPCKSSPNENCPDIYGCGLWLYPTAEQAVDIVESKDMNSLYCLAVVQGWGTVIYHEDGIPRAEIMDIWALLGIPYFVRGTLYTRLLGEIAREFRIPYGIARSAEEAVRWLEYMAKWLSYEIDDPIPAVEVFLPEEEKGREEDYGTPFVQIL